MAEMNAANPGVKIVLGGTCMHNANSFLEEVAKMEGISPKEGGAGERAGGFGGGERVGDGYEERGLGMDAFFP